MRANYQPPLLDSLRELDHAGATLVVWYWFLGSNPHLLALFTGTSNGKPFGD
jgi:hypothetical protein